VGPGPVWTCAKSLAPPGFFFTIVDRLSVFDRLDLSYLLVVRATNIGQIILLPLPKEGTLWIFPAGKIRRLRSEANPRSWVPEGSMLTARLPKLLIRSPDRPTRSQSLYRLSYRAHPAHVYSCKYDRC
jgi:hypothetical protein